MKTIFQITQFKIHLQLKKTKPTKKPSFEDNLMNILENRRLQDAETSFLMSLLPQIRSLTEEQKCSLY